MEKLAMVTGTSSGLGKAIAAALLEGGWKVIGLARRPVGFPQPGYEHHEVDLTRSEEMESWFSRISPRLTEAKLERAALVNNAGQVGPVEPIPDISVEDLKRAFHLNTLAPMLLMGHFVRECGARDLRIANISSGAARSPYASWAAYCASKAALRMAGQVVAADWESTVKRTRPGQTCAVISYEPGVVDTPMQTHLREVDESRFPAKERFVNLHEKGELLSPEHSAKALVRLLEAPAPLPPFSEHRAPSLR